MYLLGIDGCLGVSWGNKTDRSWPDCFHTLAMSIDDMRRCIGRLAGGPAGNGGIQVVSATCWTNLSGRPWRPIGSSSP